MKLIRFLFFITALNCGFLGHAQIVDPEAFLNPSIWKSQLLFQSLKGDWRIHQNPQVRKELPFDFVIVNSDWSKALLFKEGFQISAQDFAETLEFENQKYLVVALGLKSFEWQELKQILRQDQSSSAFFHFVIPKSAANSTCQATTSKDSLKEMTLTLNEKNYLQQVGDCSLQVFAGAQQQGLATLEFFQSLANNPLALVSHMKEPFNAFKNLVMDMKNQTTQMLDSLQGLTANEKQDLACLITGELLMGMGTGVLLPGAPEKMPGFGKNSHSIRLNSGYRVLYELTPEGEVIIKRVNKGQIHKN